MTRPGRPEIGPEIKARLPQDLVLSIDEFAAEHAIPRAEAVRAAATTSTALGLQPGNREPGYLHGRLFATVADLEFAATGQTEFFYGKFAACMRNPAITLKLANDKARSPAWLRKLRAGSRPDQEAAASYAERIDAIVAVIDPEARPAGSADESWFSLGYFHQKAADDRAGLLAETEDRVIANMRQAR